MNDQVIPDEIQGRDVLKSTRLSEKDLIQVRAALSRWETGAAIAARYGVSPALISQIKNGKARVAA